MTFVIPIVVEVTNEPSASNNEHIRVDSNSDNDSNSDQGIYVSVRGRPGSVRGDRGRGRACGVTVAGQGRAQQNPVPTWNTDDVTKVVAAPAPELGKQKGED
ncbi:hypothetical protein LOTGIDRAFT_165444 [Lottia gigantea]|uniref:Uncharacterized protein n=1 Tax=Lottia gigantea TaxID=225164 RepID=V4A146_LOTGI|nr:hypothetical protein LOTGIDRAFT_165444 [Lottia gigantea]ESO88660.1 hypothetical protein LOTGIDRAFT_165444 [Lottia gigantea]